MAVTEADIDIVNEIQQFYTLARREKKPRLTNWDRNYLAVHNRFFPVGRPAWMPDSRASEIFPILAALVGWMTDQRTRLSVTPSTDPHTQFYEILTQLATDLGLLMESLWIVKDWDAEVEKVLWDAMVYGTGIFKVVWDPAEDEGAGNPKVVRTDPYAVFPDPNATSFDDMNFIIESRRMSLDELDRRFPGSKNLLGELPVSGSLDERTDPYRAGRAPMANPGAMTGATASSYGLPGQGRDRATTDAGVVVHEAWLRENELWLDDNGDEYTQDRWRVVVICGNHVLMDEKAEDLWEYAGHPYTRYVLQDLGELWGIPLVDHLMPCQESVNALLGAMQHHALLCGNPIMVEDARAGIRTNITNKPGQRVQKATGSEFDWLRPPDMPVTVLQLIQFWTSEMEKISGLSAITRGYAPNTRAAQGVMDQVSESAFVRVRASLRNLERSLRAVGEQVASLIVENYTAPRTVAIVGPSGDQTSMALSTHHFYTPQDDGSGPMRYSLWVRAGATTPTSAEKREARANMLFTIGAIDRQALLEDYDYPNRSVVLQRMAQLDQLGMMNPQAPGARQRAGRSH